LDVRGRGKTDVARSNFGVEAIDGRDRLKTPSEFVNKHFRMNIRVADAYAQVGMSTDVKLRASEGTGQ
jgi:hypothetical protein